MKRKRVRRQATSADELRALFRVVERDLEQAEVPGLYPDGRYAFIYNAALQLATIVLRLRGLRVVAPGHHRETFHVVEPFVPEAMQSISVNGVKSCKSTYLGEFQVVNSYFFSSSLLGRCVQQLFCRLHA